MVSDVAYNNVVDLVKMCGGINVFEKSSTFTASNYSKKVLLKQYIIYIINNIFQHKMIISISYGL